MTRQSCPGVLALAWCALAALGGCSAVRNAGTVVNAAPVKLVLPDQTTHYVYVVQDPASDARVCVEGGALKANVTTSFPNGDRDPVFTFREGTAWIGFETGFETGIIDRGSWLLDDRGGRIWFGVVPGGKTPLILGSEVRLVDAAVVSSAVAALDKEPR
jgi:hypothetical protein